MFTQFRDMNLCVAVCCFTKAYGFQIGVVDGSYRVEFVQFARKHVDAQTCLSSPTGSW